MGAKEEKRQPGMAINADDDTDFSSYAGPYLSGLHCYFVVR